MQPPPRKVKETQQVKLVFVEQLGRLQTRQQQASELLEDIRSFSKQRATIEKEYAQALQRLAVQYQKKDWQRGKGDTLSSGSVFSVWRSLVDATAQTAVSRLAAVEDYRSLSADALRSLRNTKEPSAKRGLEELQRAQGEVVDALRELHKLKKNYSQLSHIANVAREKMADAQARSRRSDHGIFHSRSGLQKMSSKLSSRLRECDQKLTDVRNEYLLSLAATNSHHHHYYTVQLPHIMQRLDGDLYEQLRALFSQFCSTEVEASLSSHRTFSRVWEHAAKVSRESSVQLFLQDASSFTKTTDFIFQLASHDKVCVLQQQSSGPERESCLEKEVRKWSSKVAKDYKVIVHGERAEQTLEQRVKLLSGDTGASVEQKLHEVQESVRKAKVSRVKAESRLALLAGAGVDVESWLASTMSQAEEELERERRLSEARMSSGEISDLEEEFEFTDFEDYDENGDTFVDSASGSGHGSYPLPCRALHRYQASQSDELSIAEGEELQVIEDGDVEDWLKVCNSAGQVGYVPERYLQFHWSPGEGAVDLPGPSLDWSFNSSGSSSEHSHQGLQCPSLAGGLVRALYDYQAQSREELSFLEGAVIRLRGRGQGRGQGEVDDGFWEGELNGRVGVFPSLVVELIGEREEEEEEEPLPTPTLPPFSPPIPISAAPASLSSSPSLSPNPRPGSCLAHGTLPGDPEDQLQAIPLDLQRLADSRAESGGSSHSSPDLSVRRIWPVCVLQQQSSGPERESCLEKEVRKWSSKVAKDYKVIVHGERASQSDELSIAEGEELQVIEDGDVEDWLKVCNSAGQVGYVPERYLQFHWSPGEGAVDLPGPLLDWSFNSSGSSSEHSHQGLQCPSLAGGLVRALYDYQAQSREELSFLEGAVIRLRGRGQGRGQGEVDDGFWEGELNGRVGVFPSLVVELIGEREEEEEEEPLPTPTLPPFSPPIPISAAPASLSSSPSLSPNPRPGSCLAHGTLPGDPEDQLQAIPLDLQRLADSRAESGGSSHSSPDLSVRRIWPTRPPPPPPTQRHSPMP